MYSLPQVWRFVTGKEFPPKPPNFEAYPPKPPDFEAPSEWQVVSYMAKTGGYGNGPRKSKLYIGPGGRPKLRGLANVWRYLCRTGQTGGQGEGRVEGQTAATSVCAVSGDAEAALVL